MVIHVGELGEGWQLGGDLVEETTEGHGEEERAQGIALSHATCRGQDGVGGGERRQLTEQVRGVLVGPREEG